MSSAAGTSYDEVPYDSKPLYSTHPNCLAVAARLRGLEAAPPSRCRVLELGCAGGGNLIPMAYSLPESTFVGVDLSQRQIDDGKKTCSALGLKNIQLHAASIADIKESWGTFDYIIAHGVFSWVPAAIQDHMLWICRHLLSPSGVAYISYNTYPGWHLKNAIRDLMRFHAERFDDPQTKVQQARSIVHFMAKASAGLDDPLPRYYAAQSEALGEEADYYLFHEHLEDSNQPFYFREFVAKARQAGLEYLGEAWHHTVIDNLPEEIRQGLEAISSDLIELEQFVDFIRSRAFRRTLLCHREAEIVRTPDASVMDSLFVSALARPEASEPDIHSDKPETFMMDDGKSATTASSVFKAALVELYRQWPQAIAFSSLVAFVAEQLNVPAEEHSALKTFLASLLVRGYLSQVVALHVEPFRFTLTVSERPRASGLARLAAARKAPIPSLRHRLAPLSPLDRIVLSLADGSRTAEEIAAAAGPLIADLPSDQFDPSASSADSLDEAVRGSLQQLARSSLLEA